MSRLKTELQFLQVYIYCLFLFSSPPEISVELFFLSGFWIPIFISSELGCDFWIFFFFSVLQQVSSWPLSLFILTILPVLEEKATTCQVVCLEITFSWGSWPLKSWTTLVSHGSNFALQFCGVDQKVLKDFMPYSHRPTLGFPFRSFFLSFFFPY